MPVAQTLVLRRVLKGGISMNSGRVFFFVPSTDGFFGSFSWNGVGWGGWFSVWHTVGS